MSLAIDLTPDEQRRVESGRIDLCSLGIDEEQAAGLRWRFAAIAEDWDSPEMDVYDCYDLARGWAAEDGVRQAE